MNLPHPGLHAKQIATRYVRGFPAAQPVDTESSIGQVNFTLHREQVSGIEKVAEQAWPMPVSSEALLYDLLERHRWLPAELSCAARSRHSPSSTGGFHHLLVCGDTFGRACGSSSRYSFTVHSHRPDVFEACFAPLHVPESSLAAPATMTPAPIRGYLHDSVCTDLLLLRAKLSMFIKDTRQAERTCRRLMEVRSDIEAIEAAVRVLLHAEAPQLADHLDVAQQMTLLARDLSALHGVECNLHSHAKPQLHQNSDKIDLYLMLREAALNAIEHGKAGHVSVTLGADAGKSFMVQDDGQGFQASWFSRRWQGGLASIRLRAARIKAGVFFTGGRGDGACIRIDV